MKITKLTRLIILLALFATGQAFGQQAIVMVYVNSGDSQTDSTAYGDLQGRADFYSNSNYQYEVVAVNSTGAANDYSYDVNYDRAFVFAHGVDDGDPNVDLLRVNGEDVLASNLSNQFDNDYYCYKDGGGPITTSEAFAYAKAVTETE